MIKKLTTQKLLAAADIHAVADVVLLPHAPGFYELDGVVRVMHESGQLASILSPRQLAGLHPDFPTLTIAAIKSEYEHNVESPGYQEPAWCQTLPASLMRYLRFHRGLASMEYEHFLISLLLPHTGVNFFIQENGLCHRTFLALPRLWRLKNIKQLGYLQDPVVSEASTHSYPQEFSHTRLAHSLDVYALLRLIGHNNSMTDTPAGTTLALAGLLHDIETPAGGDTIKLIDPAAFDEEKHFAAALRNTAWKAFEKQYGLDRQLLVQTVQGDGLLGELLDLADKIAYVSRDVGMYLMRYAPDGPPEYPEGYRRIQNLILSNPWITGLWDAITVINNQAVITDPYRLYDFLRLRTLLFQELYFHPGARFKEFLISLLLVRYFYQRKQITRSQLLRMHDVELSRKVDELVGEPDVFHRLDQLEDVRVESFATPAEAKDRQFALQAEGIVFILAENLKKKIKAETHYQVMATYGGILPFHRAFPDLAREIEFGTVVTRPYRLYYFSPPAGFLNQKFLRAYQAWQKRQTT